MTEITETVTTNPLTRIADVVFSTKIVEANVSRCFVSNHVGWIMPPSVKRNLNPAPADRAITISNLPPINPRNLDRSALERIMYHQKDSFMRGEYYDEQLEQFCNQRQKNGLSAEFGFTITYTFSHDGMKNLTINLFVSHTEHSAAWGRYVNLCNFSHKELKKLPIKPNKFGFIPQTPMSEDEYIFVLNAFSRQCRRSLQSYLNMVYNHSIAHQIAPDYYSIPDPTADEA